MKEYFEDNGWVCIHRKLMYEFWYKNPRYLQLWIHLLLSANHREENILWNGGKLTIRPGQFITGRKKIRLQTGIPETTIERILNTFENEHQIGQQKNNKYRLITIIKWQEYQVDRTPKRTSSGQLADTNNNGNKSTEPASLNASGQKPTKNNKTMNQQKFDSDFEPIIDSDGKEMEAPRKGVGVGMRDLVRWAADRRGSKFVNIPKQYNAMKRMRLAKIGPSQIQERWIEMEDDKFWSAKGFDFMDVANSFDKKR